MSEEILINVTPRETRVALIENGLLQEVHVERTARRGLVGNIYRGVVQRVLPGIQAAFVEMGIERAAFLHLSDIHHPADAEGNGAPSAPAGERPETIQGVLHAGQELLVQVVKDPIGTKGARLTTQVSLPSRYLVYQPGLSNIGISQRIESDEERTRLRQLVQECQDAAGKAGGVIVRTAAGGVPDEVLRQDIQFLCRLWTDTCERAGSEHGPGIVYEEPPLALRVLRDLVGPEMEKVRIDSRETWQKAVDFAQRFMPEMERLIEHYPGERPIFDLYGVEDEIQKALERRVELKSGGHLVFDQTEAMTTIDVNTGAFVGHRNLEETIFKTNLEAAQSIARQLRLRNLGGIIIIDFIDMEDENHKRQVLRALEKHLERDHTKAYISSVSPLGLVEMTRKRTRESLAHVLCDACPACGGRGVMKSPQTVCYEVFREILREARAYEGAAQILVLAAQEVVDLFLGAESDSLAELEGFIGKPIRFQVESAYTQEQYDVVLM